MTDHDFRALLRDLADDLTADDQPGAGVTRAWDEGAARSRRGLLAVVGSAAAVAAAVTGFALLNGPGVDRVPAPPGPGTSSPTQPESTESPGFRLPGGSTPDGEFEGRPVFWGPTADQEERLPVLTEGRPPLPQEIDLKGVAGHGPIDHAVAAFGLGNVEGTDLALVRLLAADGTWRDLDVSNLEPVSDESGNFFVPLGRTSLSPSGTRLAFVQPNSVVIYDVATGGWSSFSWDGVESFAWEDDDHLLIPGLTGIRSEVVALDGQVTSNYSPAQVLAGHQPYGPLVHGWIASVGGYYEDAQAYYSVEGIDVPEGTITNPEIAAVSVGEDPTLLLVWPDAPGDRAKGCCPVATWLPSGQVVFQNGDRLVSWEPRSHTFHVVSSIIGGTQDSFAIASWADLSH